MSRGKVSKGKRGVRQKHVQDSTVCRQCYLEGVCQGTYLNEGECSFRLACTRIQSPSGNAKDCTICKGVGRVIRQGLWKPCMCLLLRRVEGFLKPLSMLGTVRAVNNTTANTINAIFNSVSD